MDLFNGEILPNEKNEVKVSAKTCKDCEYKQRHQCNSKVFQYCGVRKSNRTNNRLLKIKCKTPACSKFKATE
jgi:hypothetical protein